MYFGKKLKLKKLYCQFPFRRVSQWKNYVVRGRKWKKVYHCSQKRYGSFMHRAALIGADGIKNNGWSFTQILAVLARIRGHIAETVGHDCASYYGQIRTSEWATILRKPYYGLNSKLERLTTKRIPYLNFSKKADNKMCWIWTYGKIGHKIIPLSQIEFSVKGSFLAPWEYNKNFLHHTHYKFIPLIMDHVETLYVESLQIDNQEKLHRKLGEIFWWICKAKPWKLGDPSIAELLIKSIYLFHNIEPPAWKREIIPWEAVEGEPDVAQFAKHFKILIKQRSE